MSSKNLENFDQFRRVTSHFFYHLSWIFDMTRHKKAPTGAETIDSELDNDLEPEDSTRGSDDKMGSDSSDTDPRSISAISFS